MNKENGNDIILNPKTKINKNNQNSLNISNMNYNSSIKLHRNQKSELQILENFESNYNKSNYELNKMYECNSPKTINNDFNWEIIDMFNIEGIIQCDMPNPSLYMLNGKANIHLNGKSN